MTTRRVITDRMWAIMEPHCLGKPTDPGRTGSNNREFMEAILWIARTGSPWRDLPTEFGNWNTIFKRFRDWVKQGVLERMFNLKTAVRHTYVDVVARNGGHFQLLRSLTERVNGGIKA